MSALLSVAGYTLDYLTAKGPVRVLDEVSLDIRVGRGAWVFVGESGSGASRRSARHGRSCATCQA